MDRQASNVNSGPSEAFVRDLTAHQSRLRGLIRCLLFDPTDVEDVWQDTNVLLIKKADEFQPGTDFWAWSSCIARYQVLTHCKKVKRSRVIFSTDALEALAADFDALRDRVDPRRDALAR
jgi:RNA polymerase sigma-70 factor (ECF subfamily)